MINKKNKKFDKVILLCFVCIFIFGLAALKGNITKAANLSGGNYGFTGLNTSFSSSLNAIDVSDRGTQQGVAAVNATEKKSLFEQIKNWLWQTAGSKALSSAVSTALNTIAYDTATWLGSGGRGQKPMFITEGWGEYLANIADNAAGAFVESLGRQGFKGAQFNLCEPDFAVKIKIGLGLVQYNKPKKPACTFSKMKQNWEKELRDPNFLSKFQDMFNPTSNDLGIALTLQTGMVENINKIGDQKLEEMVAKKGWLDITGIDGRVSNIPLIGEKLAEQIQFMQTIPFLKNYNDEFVQAANIFLNQLAITLVNEQLKKLGQGKRTSGPYNWDGLTNPDAGMGSGGVQAAKDQLRKLTEPRFNVRGDYNILGELTQCPNPNKAGPTNCVITDRFSQAIQNRVTVGQAIKEGYLNPEGVFGFTASTGVEPSYQEGYPYRSMIILRKFRILPVGWEVAAQYLRDNPDLVGGAKNLGDLVACFNQNDEYAGYYDDWCQGLVDPNWVLKAPLNYCRREGSGPEILSSSVSGSGSDSSLSVTRNDKYCADEQSCIKENADGSCQIYGYCTEERRKWSFDAKACESQYNTCQTFKTVDGSGGQSGGQTISYLKNTLDYQGCSVDNAGCKAYCQNYDYATGRFTCTAASSAGKIYLDRDAAACDAKNEGCHEFVRARVGQGANLLVNSSFEDEPLGGWAALGATTTTAYDGASGLALNTGNLTMAAVVGPATANIEDDSFVLSFYSRDCDASSTFQISNGPFVNFAGGNSWSFNQASLIPSGMGGNSLNLNFSITAPGCVIDAVKLERGYRATAYSDYANNPKIYEKLLPGYLSNVCYDAAGNLRPTAPAECQNFVRACSAGEVGCEMFTSVTDRMSIPAKVTAKDYCAAECVGYDTYMQTQSTFDSSRVAYMIPKTGASCSAAAAGCDQFTNLDEVARGGEGIENYSALRQCIKPDPTGCSEFYTWEGSNETGYQLRVMTLNFLNGPDGTPDPVVTENDAALCNETIYNLLPTDPSYNSDCREFYNTAGVKRWHLNGRTISCSDDCHPYRRTENNIVKDATGANLSQAACNALSQFSVPGQNYLKDINYAGGQCIFCKNRGTWSPEHNACIYQAITAESRSCAANQVGCREYTGSRGRNERIVVNHDFEDGTRDGWSGVGAASVVLSNESVIMGGHSLGVDNAGAAAMTLAAKDLAQADKSYVLSFIAKSSSTALNQLSADFVNSSGATDSFGSVVMSTDWQYYEVSLARLLNPVDAGEQLRISAAAGFFIDNLRLVEIVDRYYLIKNSWQTPETCDRDLNGNPYAGYMLGCDEYTDRERETHYLKSFTSLCSEAAVGCELMIDTKNSIDPARTIYNDANSNGVCDGNEIDCLVVPADEYAYVVYDAKKLCNREDKGCERLGKPYNYENGVLYSDVYLKNNPDDYGRTLCTADAADCNEYSSDSGLSYFKDPGDQLCQWRQVKNSWGWFQKQVNRCDTDGNGAGDGDVCLKDADCSNQWKCLMETEDRACSSNPYKTLGYGGAGNRVSQPGTGWAGVCPAESSGCGELIDPISRFSSNAIFNADFEDIDGNGTYNDGWQGAGPASQAVKLEQYTLYRLAGSDPNGNSLELDCPNSFYELDASNLLSWRPAGAGPEIVVNLGGASASKLFYSDANTSCTVTVNAINGGATRVELKQAAIDYQLAKDLDKQSCGGAVNFSDGCVLFNERGQNGPNLTALTYDADRSSTTPFTASDDTRDSNSLIKVAPDRVCDKWLACKSKITIKNERGEDENYCFDIGLCNGLDQNGNCSSFLLPKKTDQTYPNLVGIGQISDLSGYAKAGYQTTAVWPEPNDYYPLSAMKQTGETINLSNGSFEFSGSNGYPMGWTYEPPTTGSKQVWDSSIFKVIDNPISAQQENIKYPREGKNFLKLGSTFNANSEFIDVVPASYVLSAYLNTKNASRGEAEVVVTDGTDVIPIFPGVELSAGNDWGFKLGRFTISAASGISKIKIQLKTKNSPEGNFYFDDVAIRPALESKDLTPGSTSDFNYWYTPSSCRLYPESDSLSCNYYDSSGIRQRGWSGYCLEHDRAPGSSDACLLWWPVDKIKGDGIEEGIGYLGRYPLYYCAQSTLACGDKSYCKKLVQTVTPTGMNKYWSGRVYQGSDYVTAGTTSQSYTYNSDFEPFGAVASPYPTNNPFEWDSDPDTQILDPLYSMTESSNQARQGQVFEHDINNCNQTFGHWMGMGGGPTADSGDLGYWDQCVFNGYSDDTSAPSWCAIPYEPPEFRGRYQLVVTANVGGTPSDPSTICKYGLGYWDTPIGKYWVAWGADGDGGNGVRFTASETCNSSSTKPGPAVEILKRLYAQSYNAWEWQGYCMDINKNFCLVGGTNVSCTSDSSCAACGAAYTCQDMRYRQSTSPGWVSPSTLCTSGVRPAYDIRTKTCNNGDCFACPGPTCDYCAITPVASNIRANGITANVTVAKSGLVNLTFNSRVDSQQLPLVMYEVRWGDGESTVVSGVEMRDRPNADNPHSLYHLYNYWDLKSKDNLPDPQYAGIICGASSCTVQPSVKIKDNWGWCNGDPSGSRGQCSTYVPFGANIVVTEN